MLSMVSFIQFFSSWSKNSSYLFMIESLCFTIIGLDCKGQCCYLIVLNKKGGDFVSNYYEYIRVSRACLSFLSG